MSIEIDRENRNGILIDGEKYHVISGSVHYWRHHKDKWSLLLDRVRELGFRMVQTYIPWSVHEVTKGDFDFGREKEEKDLSSFLDICSEKDLKVLVRPGPHINSEMAYFGYPKRILFREDIQARTAWGTPFILRGYSSQFPVPSYSSPHFFREVEVYFEALMKVLKPHIHPKGPVVMCQTDNEMGFFFNKGIYTLDYHPSAVEEYREWLKSRYGEVGELNKAYGRRHTDFSSVEPPREYDPGSRKDLVWYMDWAAYREYHTLKSLEKIASMLRAGGMDVPFFHNTYGIYTSPIDISSFENTPGLDVMGLDVYPHKEAYGELKRLSRMASGMSVMPFIPEFGSGVWASWKPFTPEEEMFTTYSALAHGIKAFNFYMIVERERWTGSPITRRGGVREPYARIYKSLFSFLSSFDFLSAEKQAQVALVLDKDMERYRLAVSDMTLNTSGAFSLPPEVSSSGDKHFPGLTERYVRWTTGCESLLDRNGICCDMVDTGISLECLKRYKAVIAPTFYFISRDTCALYEKYVRSGGTLIFGPEVPSMDTSFEPFSGFENMENIIGPGRAYYVKEFPGGGVPENMVSFLPKDCHHEMVLDGRGLDMSLFRISGGVGKKKGLEKIAFVLNPSDREIRGRFLTSSPVREVTMDGKVNGGSLDSFKVPPYTVKIYGIGRG